MGIMDGYAAIEDLAKRILDPKTAPMHAMFAADILTHVRALRNSYDSTVEQTIREIVKDTEHPAAEHERAECAGAIESLKRQMFSGSDWCPGPQDPARLKALNDAIVAIRARGERQTS